MGDVIVVGGGPAGLATAEAAARGGRGVLLIEQNKEIGGPIRTSGGSFLPELTELGIPERLLHPVWRCRFVGPASEVVFEWDKPDLCIMDVRGVYQHLAERAIAAGVKMKLATRVDGLVREDGRVHGVRVQEQTFPAETVVDATGYRAALLREAGVHSGFARFGVGAEYDLYAPNWDENEVVLLVGNRFAPAGYGWIFPWGRGRVRAGIGIIHGDSREKPEGYLDKLVDAYLPGAQPVEVHQGMIPSDGLAAAYAGAGILGVGDAAGHPSALVGEGIRWAIEAGRMAGGCLAAHLPERFPGLWDKAHGRDLRIAAVLNRRMAGFEDEQWERALELLRRFRANEFGEALRSRFLGAWALKLLWKNPRILTLAGHLRR
ncbi:MAG: NAD(P)/FAD-dependent oxidoreductase [Bryobacterales bacterium]|nr:NAD(P)/FAD-dependent oxidoreductase [Bryobacterales bacterium]